jgi:acyl dehydratase
MAAYQQRGRYFEEFTVGEELISPGRTITEGDVAAYAGLSGDYNQLHTDEEYCRTESPFGTRIVHGLFTLSLTEGLKSRLGYFEGTSIASMEWTWRFLKPVFIGDTVRVRVTVKEKRETRKPDRGIVREAVSVLNQRDEIVAEGEHLVMMKRKFVAHSA